MINFNNPKHRRTFSAIIVIILVLAMVVTMFLPYIN